MKTVQFHRHRYVGDPINTVRIFNEKEVDEIAVFDIDATVDGRPPDLELVRRLAAECRMPLCYGGGVTNTKVAARLVSLGVEKVAVSAGAFESSDLIATMSKELGAQSVVAVFDVRQDLTTGRYEVWTHNGTRATGIDVFDAAARAEDAGVGEVTVNSIDRDGTMVGYDLYLARALRKRVGTPITIVGGAGSIEHFTELYRAVGVVGAGAGTVFVFKGQLRAVLITYPRREKKREIFPNTVEERTH